LETKVEPFQHVVFRHLVQHSFFFFRLLIDCIIITAVLHSDTNVSRIQVSSRPNVSWHNTAELRAVVVAKWFQPVIVGGLYSSVQGSIKLGLGIVSCSKIFSGKVSLQQRMYR
jgi:hypothetical protein